ncbi:hypothetical protein A2803_02255 [Candidatus Woesebacteria bacterium RIFCSPHIGHO2_01_FULL_44_21]|uniref:Uncharacterized protein n=1 Tax=Candidatus Woesebacteria bacterium RIFCSPHIGHO2_01_FULL_44_21 TaxID=1802503 RepID=A0A1F7YYH9_9BACT|nr:MAG: hypothetical protein A2803_02255 [Candidatus Woesebacteria bacterium RIFCSPHIGHO2_01_FULL_44_21]OGM70422.1 MAG: hypothetical protein A2897_01520 [Candidatus Woesebacteria bacterium RIFCSPLOWO2_01_FULL_44_24b]
MIQEAESLFWKKIAPGFPDELEPLELNAFEKILQEDALTLEEFKEYNRANDGVKFLLLGMRGPELTKIVQELGVGDFNALIESYTYKCPTYDDTFRVMSTHYLEEGFHLVIMLPANQLFTHEQAKNTRTEAKILLGERFSGYYNQITFVTGLYGPTPD